MKKFVLSLFFSMAVTGLNFAQSGRNLYTILVNVVNEEFRFPLLGAVNIAGGSHSSPQIGFVNWNQNNFSTMQLGFVNTAGGNMAGLQLGFVNTSANRIDGAQVSFVNFTKQLNGLQLGFINYVDSIENGVPIGFLSIVRNGGYKAVELGVSEISPFNAAFKIGIERFYSSFIVSYNPFADGIRNQILWGIGFGSIIPIGRTFFFNPELTTHHAINERFQHYLGVVSSFGFAISSNISVAAGPSLVWMYVDNDKGVETPFYHVAEHSINERNKLIVGARMALRFRW
jgi:hypothetical protein